MAERYLDLALVDRREVLDVSASASGRPAYLLERDVWVVWSLDTLFAGPLGAPLAFKGGTSLSKAYGAVRRSSEDVDLTYDIRALVPELVRGRLDALPPNPEPGEALDERCGLASASLGLEKRRFLFRLPGTCDPQPAPLRAYRPLHRRDGSQDRRMERGTRYPQARPHCFVASPSSRSYMWPPSHSRRTVAIGCNASEMACSWSTASKAGESR